MDTALAVKSRRRPLALAEWLVLAVIAAILVGLCMPARQGPPPLTDDDLDFTGWDPTSEAALAPPRELVDAGIAPAGNWACLSIPRIRLEIEPAQGDAWNVLFTSSGRCGLGTSVRLTRTAAYRAGTLTLNHPVQDVLGKSFQRLYAVRVHGREYLVPSVRLDQVNEILRSGTPKEQTDALDLRLLSRDSR